MGGTAHGADRTDALIHDIRHGLHVGMTSTNHGALPRMLASLASSTLAHVLYADKRSTSELVDAVAEGDHPAEEALYVRVAADLHRVAAKARGMSAMDREDLHQEGAERLVADARSGKIRDAFGGQIGPYLGRAVLCHLRNRASTQTPGRPTDPGRYAQKMREALTKTADADGEHVVWDAYVYAHEHFGWRAETFFEIRDSMALRPVDHDTPTPCGLTVAETAEDRTADDGMERVEAIETARALRSAGALSARERDVIDALFGFAGPVMSEVEAANLLGMTQQAVNKIKRRALATLRAVAEAA